MFDGEIKKLNTIMQKKFEAFDTNADKKHTGFISFSQMEQCFHSTSWITPKELNLLLRDSAMQQGYD